MVWRSILTHRVATVKFHSLFLKSVHTEWCVFRSTKFVMARLTTLDIGTHEDRSDRRWSVAYCSPCKVFPSEFAASAIMWGFGISLGGGWQLLLSTHFFLFQESQDAQESMTLERSGISCRPEYVDIGTEITKNRVMRPSWIQKTFLRGFTIRWNTVFSRAHVVARMETSCQKPALRNFLLNPDANTEQSMALVCSSTIVNRCGQRIGSLS